MWVNLRNMDTAHSNKMTSKQELFTYFWEGQKPAGSFYRVSSHLDEQAEVPQPSSPAPKKTVSTK